MIAVPAGDKTSMVGQYVAEKAGGVFEDGLFSAFAILDDNSDFVAGVIVSNFRGHDCEISGASESSMAGRPWVMKAVFEYVFGQLGCARCTAHTQKANTKARKFLEAVGFVLEGNLRLGYDGKKDALVYGLLASECRYFERDLVDGRQDADRARAA